MKSGGLWKGCALNRQHGSNNNGSNIRGGKRHLLGDLVTFDPVKVAYTQLSDGSSGEGPSRRYLD